jgi:photosystem II stability/assembly factor-like uncharacterized protein
MLRSYFFYILLSLSILIPKRGEAQWKKFQMFDEKVIYKAIHVDADTFYVSGGSGIYATFNAGNNWIKRGYESVPMGLNDLHFFNSKVGIGIGEIGVGNSAIVVKTFDGGQTWGFTYVSNDNAYPREIFDIEFVDKLNGYAVGTNKQVIKTSNGGNSWTNLTPIVENTNIGIKMNSVNQGYIVSPWFIQGFNGQSITGTTLVSSPSRIIDVQVTGSQNIFAATSNRLSKTTNSGTTWTHLPFPYSKINTLLVLTPQDIYLGTDNGVYVSRDGGVNWELFKETKGEIITSIIINSKGKGLAVGKYGSLFRTDNFGGASTPIVEFELSSKEYCNRSMLILKATNIQNSYTYKWVMDSKVISTKAIDSIQFTTKYSGYISLVCSNTFATDTLAKYYNVYVKEVTAKAGNDVYACSNEPIHLSASGGIAGYQFTWSPLTGLSNPNIRNPIATHTSTIEYVVTVANGLCISRDTVVVYRDSPVPLLDFKEMNAPDLDGRISSIQMVDDKTGYALGLQHLYKTTDGGLNWSKSLRMDEWTSSVFGDVEFVSPDIGYFGNIILYKTTDGGKTATKLYGSYVVDVEFVTPDVGYKATTPIGGELGIIERTIDGGRTWANVYSSQGRITKIKCFSSGRCVATGYLDINSKYVTFLYSNDGVNWKKAIHEEWVSAGSTYFWDISFVNDQTGYATGGDHVWKTIDGGVSWKKDYYLPYGTFISFLDDQNGIITTRNPSSIYLTVNAGACWENLGTIGMSWKALNRLYVSGNKKVFISTELQTFEKPDIWQADFLQPLKRDQTIQFSIPSVKKITDSPFRLGALASSNLPVDYEVSDESVVSVAQGVLTIKNIGEVQITVKQKGNLAFNPAPPVTKTLTITKVPQTITFLTALQKLITDPPFQLNGTASSGLPVTYSSSDESIVSITNDLITLKKSGVVQITARQVGNGIFEAAAPIVQTLEVLAIPQTIQFSMPTQKTILDPPFTLSAVASSGLTVSFRSSDESIVSITDSQATIKKLGSVSIIAEQPGNNTYATALPVTINIAITKAPQNITFSLPTKHVGDPDFILDAITDSGLPITYSLNNTTFVELFENNWIRIKAAGSTNVTAIAQSSDLYDQASIIKNLEVKPAIITGFEDNTGQPIIIFPNPASRDINIDLTGLSYSRLATSVSIFDVMGKSLITIAPISTQEISLDVSGLASGVYFVHIIFEDKSHILKFIRN